MPRPQDFFLGAMSFFGILLPGAIACAVIWPWLTGLAIGGLPEAGVAGGWIAFVVVAYVIGHIVFLVGAWLDPLYDWIRRRLDPYRDGDAYDAVVAIKREWLGDAHAGAINAFQWSRSMLLLWHPAGASDVEVYEADSKFFRSLTVVGTLVAGSALASGDDALALLAAAAVVACFFRYYDRRLKAVKQAYTHVIVAHASGKFGAEPG